MDTQPATPQTAPALSRTKAWLVGGGLALVAAGSLATALVLKGPSHTAKTSEPRETIVSSKSPSTGTAGATGAAGTKSPAPKTATAPAGATTARNACADCAVVQAVTAIERRGEPTGLGAVGGAVAGGLLGSQMGGGSGKDAMTVIGAVGGGVAGHHMERKMRSTTEYRVRVAMADGSTRTLSHPTRLAVGERVRVQGDRLVALAAPAATPSPAPAATTRTAERNAAEERPRSMADAKRL